MLVHVRQKWFVLESLGGLQHESEQFQSLPDVSN
jgi:hypothetical protein